MFFEIGGFGMSPARITLALAHRILGADSRTLEKEERRVIDGISERKPISVDAGELAEKQEGFWDGAADKVASIGGSWPFIFGFFIFLLAWVGMNSVVLARSNSAFDPYPFIFLNLVLSMLAAIQAPIIMMSQNRQAQKDRIAATHDYEVNLRSEIEILGLQEKLDVMRTEQHLELLSQHKEMLDLLRAMQK
ncbi:MAG: DUF1003 domain-containing protein [Parasphingorhabdus sp.]|uniref:DUF1003 domain-containing protein n=1 Tax=Parasphingorhabdus sp. TaxID=2709688 RepID=UPI0030038A52